MPAGPSKLRLLHPKWLLLHALTIAACLTMLLLGRWQWDVAHRHHGDIRYYAYAFQWWAFVGFALLMWYRVILDYLRAGRRPASQAGQPANQAGQPANQAGQPATQPMRSDQPPASRYLAYTPPAVPTTAERDPERLRFNAYLARLNAADQADRKGTE